MMNSRGFPWYYCPWVAANNVEHDYPTNNYQFEHFFFNHRSFEKSDGYSLIIPLISKLSINGIVRIKGNLYPSVNGVVEDQMHSDFPFPHKGALFSINTNNGYTKLEDGTKIESVENRLLIFDTSTPHCSARCTDEKVRVNIVVNYF